MHENGARRQAREIALQALYAWQLSGDDPLAQARTIEGFDRDRRALRREPRCAACSIAPRSCSALISPHLSREFGRLSPVERAILYIGTFELATHAETPFKVVLNEAIELGKSFGGTDGYRFVNGVLEKIAAALRPEEVAPRHEPTPERIRPHRAVFHPARPTRRCSGWATIARCCARMQGWSSPSPPTC